MQLHTQRARGRLQPEGIVGTALDLMNRIGLDALSLRRLAEELQVQAPALYWHFKNKQELLDAMAERMIFSSDEPLSMPAAQAEWSEWLTGMAHTLRGALLRYRDGARLLAVADVSKTSIISLDLALGVLVEAGFGYQAALIGIMTIINYTLGFTFEEQSSTRHDNDLASLRETIAANRLSYLAAAFEEKVMIPDSNAEFAASLRLVIEGLRAQL